MKKITLSALLIFLMLASFAQSYNNEWIDYSKTYYKFKVAANGLYRINQSTLAAAGLANANAEDYELWRNGEIVPVYTSVASGPLPANGFIEFYGLRNDGKPDKVLYRKQEYQLNDKYSLETDTATYFLTVHPGTVNSHYILDNNDIVSNSRPAEPYFMYTLGNYFNARINAGNAAVIGTDFVYSSSYDKGEGFANSDYFPSNTYNISNSNLNVEPTGPDANFNYAAFGNSSSSRTMRVSLNGTPILAQPINYFESVKGTVNNIPVSLISSNTATYSTVNDASTVNDRIAVFYYELVYPRKFVFDGSGIFPFDLPAKPDTSFLQISNFGHGNVPPVLYDITNQRVIIGDISDPSFVKIVLPPSGVDRKMVLLSREPGNIRTVNELTARNFIDFSNPSNQGDYVIISNPVLYNDGSGNNYVDQYRLYRSSPAGGGYIAQVYNIPELVDQFAFGIKNHPSSIKNFLRFARNVFAQKPKSCFIIGKGVTYPELRRFENLAVTSKINLVPTFGWPASDNLLASETSANPTPATPIGRLSVVYPNEIRNYLDKVKEYENNLNTNSCTIADKAW
ncbi:MAG: C25 family cysteine peptidase, partial [Sphingobacteriales bacterium]